TIPGPTDHCSRFSVCIENRYRSSLLELHAASRHRAQSQCGNGVLWNQQRPIVSCVSKSFFPIRAGSNLSGKKLRDTKYPAFRPAIPDLPPSIFCWSNSASIPARRLPTSRSNKGKQRASNNSRIQTDELQ